MKCLVFFAILHIGIHTVVMKPRVNKCLVYFYGQCLRECEEPGTHAYHGTVTQNGCKFMASEPTCDNPTPVEFTWKICDYHACHCDHPTIRHPETRNCVTFDQCEERK